MKKFLNKSADLFLYCGVWGFYIAVVWMILFPLDTAVSNESILSFLLICIAINLGISIQINNLERKIDKK